MARSTSQLSAQVSQLAGSLSVRSISEEALAQAGIKRLYRKRDTVYTFVDLSEYEATCQRARRLLVSCEGYFYAGEYDDLKLTLAGEQMASRHILDAIEARARRFRAAGVPPIFSSAYTGHVVRELPANETRPAPVQIDGYFPVIDFILQFTAGTLHNRIAARAMDQRARRKGRVGFIPIPHATPDDVRAFCTLAFTSDGRIKPALIREATDYVAKHYTFKDEAQKDRILDADYLSFLWLEEMLRDVDIPRVQPKSWNGDFTVLDKRLWHLWYDEATIKTIINDFVASLAGTPKGEERKRFRRLCFLFPNELAGRMDELVAREQTAADAAIINAMAHAAATHDYRNVPEVVFVQEPYKSRYRMQIANHFRAMAARLGRAQPDILFGNAQALGTYLRVPERLALVPEFKVILDDERLKAVTTMANKDFISCFTNRGRRSSIGHAKVHPEAQVSGFMRRYINRRYKRLVP